MDKLGQVNKRTKARILNDLITRLMPDHPGNTAHDEVKAHLREIRLWLHSWILPELEGLLISEQKKIKARKNAERKSPRRDRGGDP